MDHSAHGSMKNAASCETWCELQDTLSTDFSNAHCGLGYYPGPRLSEGRINACRRRFFLLIGRFGEVILRRPKSCVIRHREASRSKDAQEWELADSVRSRVPGPAVDARVVDAKSWIRSLTPFPMLSTSDQARRPAEFKHINKRRKRNQQRFP